MSALIIGTGFAGLGMAIQLKQAGIEDFVLLEQADDVGGVWRDNQYPGCACDVRSHLYSFSFEPNPNWTREYGPQREILAYLRHCADKYGIRPYIRFGERMDQATYDEAAGRWNVRTSKGTHYRPQVLINGMGGLSRPAIPELEGQDRFSGPAFHSARWDHSVDLTGKRVAVIGTGASAIQFVPGIVDRVGHIDIYQRSAPWVLPKDDGDIPKARRKLFKRLPALQRAVRESIYWRSEGRIWAFVRKAELMKYGERQALQFLAEQVPDPELRRKLTPDYAMGCKRILLSNDWYPAVTREHVDVVTDGIEALTERGVRTRSGEERPADVIIYGTGFMTQTPLPEGSVIGRDGRDLAVEWRDTASAYKGTTVSGYPNFFLLGGPNTGIGHTSMVYMLESQFAYVLDAMRLMREQKVRSVEVRRDAQVAYNERLQSKTKETVWGAGCSGWYFNKDGVNTTLWPNFTYLFRKLTAQFDAQAYLLEAGEPAQRAPGHPDAGVQGKVREAGYDLTA